MTESEVRSIKRPLACQDVGVTVRPTPVSTVPRLLLLAVFAFLIASCGSSTEVDAAAVPVDVDVAAAKASAAAGDWGCTDGYEPAFSAVADEGFEYLGKSYDPLRISICRAASGEFYFYGENLVTGETKVLSACLEGGLTWAAADDEASYRIIDVRDRDDLSGQFVQTDPDGEWLSWNLRTEVFRDVEAQVADSSGIC